MAASAAQAVLRSTSRVALLRQLMDQSALSARDLGTRVGLHENTVRDHLQLLERKGLIASEFENRTVRGRPRRLYALTPAGAGTLNEAAQVASAIELGRVYRKLNPETATPLPPEAWDQLDVIEDYLDRCGFQPRFSAGEVAFTLRCPFQDVFASLGRDVCRVHAELVSRLIGSTDGPFTAGSLTPFTSADACVIRLMIEK